VSRGKVLLPGEVGKGQGVELGGGVLSRRIGKKWGGVLGEWEEKSKN